MPHLSRRTVLAGLAGGVFAGVAGTAGLTACRSTGDDDTTQAARTLVLYDTTGQFGHLGELYATQVANLASRFGNWHARPASAYQQGEHRRYAAIVYVGSTYDEPLPPALLDDVAGGAVPVLWLGGNIWQLFSRRPELADGLGFRTGEMLTGAMTRVRYRGTELHRSGDNAAGLVKIDITHPGRAKAVAEVAPAGDPTSTGGGASAAGPTWAVRSGWLTYVSEVPLTYLDWDDRYLAFTDMLFDLLAPDTATRHQALVRLEDVSPASSPADLRAVADYLAAQRVPFAVAVYAEHVDGAGADAARPRRRSLVDAPEVVAALKYMVERGGTLVMHGYRHATLGTLNPKGVSGTDYEFLLAREQAGRMVLVPLPGDSAAWATAQVTEARKAWEAAGLPLSDIWEFPHYAASATAYQAISPLFAARYEQATYYSGVLTGGKVDQTRSVGQFFPYPVRDIYGTAVIPESLGNYVPVGSAGARSAADVVASARRQLVVRDGVASFFYHPYLGVTELSKIVEGVKALGYQFVPATSLILPRTGGDG